MPRPLRDLRLLLIAALAILGAGAIAVYLAVNSGGGNGHGIAHAGACPPGFVNAAAREPNEREREGGTGEREERAREDLRGCLNRKHPESVGEIMAANARQSARASAPATSVKPGAYAAAARRKKRLARRPKTYAGAGGTWAPAGHGPLIADDPRYGEVNGEGLKNLSGRINGYAYDNSHKRLFAAVGEGGVWESGDLGQSWRSIGDPLPTQAIGSVGYSPANGGTVIVTTGDDVYGGGGTFAGVGVYRTINDGRTWTKATGVPDGVISFKVAVDPTNPNVVYAATGAGLFRSTDAGASFTNVRLPTGAGVAAGQPNCTGAAPTKVGCYLANMVTDVVVRAPGGVGADKKGGAVVAAVGWRAGNKLSPASRGFPNGYVESPNNGIYVSPTGAPNTFKKVDTSASGFADGAQGKIGRTELGAATGAKQDHNYLYAIVADATAFKSGVISGIDVPEAAGATPSNTYFLGVYVSKDFGKTWTRMANATQLENPASGSALTGTACTAQLYCPGVQAWYNEWIQPDPTQADPTGVPTRLTFGLEELWESRLPLPQNGPMDFKVIGPYFSDQTCLFLNAGLPNCPTQGQGGTSPGDTTTHPDQHGAIYIPDGKGGSTLIVGNDGGAYAQHVAAGQDFSDKGWGSGINDDFSTLLPYDAQVAKDGTIWSGLQDNGEMKIEPTGKRFMTFGGDGGFDAVDPDNSANAYEGLDGGGINVTSDGGKTWNDITPPSDNYQFTNPFVMDPNNPAHLMTAGSKVWETTNAPTADWTQVFDLGTAPSGAARQMSALDVRGAPTGAALPSGPATRDFSYTGGGSTIPGLGSGAPKTFDDHPFKIGANDGDAKLTVRISWADSGSDWDLELLRKEGSNLVQVQSSAQGGTTSEQVVVPDPKPGDYVIRVDNYQASGTFKGTAKFAQRPAGAGASAPAAYVAFCGYCEPLVSRPFTNGIATNVGGSKPGKELTSDGWHFAKAKGLPLRYITSVQIDPSNPRTVYVTVAGYSRRWLPVGVLGEIDPAKVGHGHVFKSTDAGNTFTDISGNLPDIPADWTVVRNGQLVVGTDVGVFIARGTSGGTYQVLGKGLPTAPVFTMELKPKATTAEPDKLVVATQGRGVWTYTFKDPAKKKKR